MRNEFYFAFRRAVPAAKLRILFSGDLKLSRRMGKFAEIARDPPRRVAAPNVVDVQRY